MLRLVLALLPAAASSAECAPADREPPPTCNPECICVPGPSWIMYQCTVDGHVYWCDDVCKTDTTIEEGFEKCPAWLHTTTETTTKETTTTTTSSDGFTTTETTTTETTTATTSSDGPGPTTKPDDPTHSPVTTDGPGTGTTSASTTDTTTSPPKSAAFPLGAIAGAGAGVLILVGFCCGGFWWRKRVKKDEKEALLDEENAPATLQTAKSNRERQLHSPFNNEADCRILASAGTGQFDRLTTARDSVKTSLGSRADTLTDIAPSARSEDMAPSAAVSRADAASLLPPFATNSSCQASCMEALSAPCRARFRDTSGVGAFRVVPQTPWEDFALRGQSLLDWSLTSTELRERVPRVTGIVDDCRHLVQDLRIGSATRDLAQDFTDDELASVCMYTHDSSTGAQHGQFYYEENCALRKGDVQDRIRMLKGFGPHIYYMLRATDKLPDIKATVYRGLPGRELFQREYLQGRTIQFGAWTSTTTNIEVAKGFMKELDGVILNIKVHTGKCISGLSVFPGEDEVLLTPNHRLVVSRELYEEGGFWYVDLVEVRSGNMLQS